MRVEEMGEKWLEVLNEYLKKKVFLEAWKDVTITKPRSNGLRAIYLLLTEEKISRLKHYLVG